MHSKVDLLRVFVSAAESGSFKEAAEKLAMSPQSVSRVIKDLEQEFGELLFHRNTRTVKITKFGEEVLSHASNAINVVSDVFLLGKKKNEAQLTGKVTITTPNIVGRDFLYPALRKIQVSHPQIQIEIRASNTFSNLVGEQIDFGIRVGKISNNSFVAKKVNELRFFLAASPDMLKKHGLPKTLDELKKLPAVQLIDSNTGRARPWVCTQGKEFLPENIMFSTDDPEIARLAMLDGVGFGELSNMLSKNDVADGNLVKIFSKFEPKPWDIYVYRPQRGPIAPSVRVVHDTVVDYLRSVHLRPV